MKKNRNKNWQQLCNLGHKDAVSGSGLHMCYVEALSCWLIYVLCIRPIGFSEIFANVC